ncbi:MAG: hypothetical protein U0984_12315, partial [Prosthecobacter sp.]|nr:hypothetical protein [Prosthecobacter sp.]
LIRLRQIGLRKITSIPTANKQVMTYLRQFLKRDLVAVCCLAFLLFILGCKRSPYIDLGGG